MNKARIKSIKAIGLHLEQLHDEQSSKYVNTSHYSSFQVDHAKLRPTQSNTSRITKGLINSSNTNALRIDHIANSKRKVNFEIVEEDQDIEQQITNRQSEDDTTSEKESGLIAQSLRTNSKFPSD